MARGEPSQLDAETIRAVTRLLEERLKAVELYGAGGCVACHEAEARAFAAHLRRLAEKLQK